MADRWPIRTSPDYNCKVANQACRKRRLSGTPQWQSALLVVGLPVNHDWFERGCHFSPSLISIRLKDSKFELLMQLPEPTNITNNAQLLVYVRYTTRDNDVKTELLMSKKLPSTTKGKDVFEILDNFSNRLN